MQKLRKHLCDNNQFYDTDFSGSAYMNKNGYTIPLSDYQSAKLMKELKASYYLNTDSCSPDTDVYLPLENGWNNGKGITNM